MSWYKLEGDDDYGDLFRGEESCIHHRGISCKLKSVCCGGKTTTYHLAIECAQRGEVVADIRPCRSATCMKYEEG